MRGFLILAAALAALSSAAAPELRQLGDSPKGVERVYSSVITNLAWGIYKIEVRDGRLFDPTGTLVAKEDLEYLELVAKGIPEVLDAGSNAFVRAKEDFEAALREHPIAPATFVSMIVPTHADLDPADRDPYGLIVGESATNLDVFLSRPFGLKPTVAVETVYLDDDGNVVTNYDTCSFVDYHNDATNFPAREVGPYPRTVRMIDPKYPEGVVTCIRDSHLHYGHPQHGMMWGGMDLALQTTNGLLYAVTGVYTAKVDGVWREWTLKNGATIGELKEVER